jgi:hypothetical protein
MGTTVRRPATWRSTARLAALAVAAVAVVVLLAVVPPWILVLVPSRIQRQVTIGLLLGTEAVYVAAAVAALTGTILLGLAVTQRRRHREPVRPIMAKLLLLSVSTLLASFVAEGGAMTRRAWDRRITPLPETFADVRLPDLGTRAAGEGRGAAGGEIRIVVIGESSAEGLPYSRKLSIGTLVAWGLEQALPGRRVSVDVMAHSGATLGEMHRKLAGLTYRPDVVIVYAGHNEFASRYSWSNSPAYYADTPAPRPRQSLEQIAGRFSSVCGLIHDWAEAQRVPEPPPPRVTRKLVDVPVYTPEEYATRREDFRARLDAIAAFCRRIGALAVLVVPSGNDAGFEPNRSMLAPETPRAAREAFARDFLAARAAESSDPARAESQYRVLLNRQPGFAEAHFRLARLREKAGAYDEAYTHYVVARDRDGLPMRCPSDFQHAYREVSARQGAALVDGPAVFRTRSPHGLLDDWLFNDGIHPSLRGHIALAQGVLERLRQWPALGWPPDAPTPSLDPAACAVHFNMDSEGWRGVCELTTVIWKILAFARFDPTERLDWARRYDEAAHRIAVGKKPEELGIPGLGLAPLSSAPGQRGRVTAPASSEFSGR